MVTAVESAFFFLIHVFAVTICIGFKCPKGGEWLRVLKGMLHLKTLKMLIWFHICRGLFAVCVINSPSDSKLGQIQL